MEIREATTACDFAEAGKLFRAYAEDIGIDLQFQHFDEELAALPGSYAAPFGIILLAQTGTEYTGCIAVRPKAENIAELKRMYVKPGFRGKSIARKLLESALTFAKKAGYQRIRLDTLDTMLPAIALYKEHGFYEIEAYYFNPEKNAVFFEKTF